MRKIKFDGEKVYSLKEEERMLMGLLAKFPVEPEKSKILYEEAINFYGLWESSLYFYCKKNNTIVNCDELKNLTKKTFKEYNNIDTFKSYNLIVYNEKEYHPLFSFFFYSKTREKFVKTFIYDTNNPKIDLKKLKNTISFPILEEMENEIIEDKIIHIEDFNSYPFLFLRN